MNGFLRQALRLTASPGIGVLAMTIAGCGGSPAGPSGGTIDLSGTWSGVVGAASGGGRALRVTWQATQRGSSVSGPATLSTSPAVTDLTFTGTLAGSLAGTQLALTFVSSQAGVAGSADCRASADGTAEATSAAMSGNLDVTFLSCDAPGLQPPASDRLTLTKQ